MSLKRNYLWGTGTGPTSSSGAQQGGVSGVLDCTIECRAKEHALLVLSAAYLGNLKLLKHCASVCANPLHIQDALGRNALHVAASKGHLQLVHWLLARKKVKVDVSDLESKWTALHRCAYYGQLGAAALLLKVGGCVCLQQNVICDRKSQLTLQPDYFTLHPVKTISWGITSLIEMHYYPVSTIIIVYCQ